MTTRKRRRELSRRQFLMSGATVGMAASVPGLLSGCGDDGHSGASTPTPTPGRGSRELRTLHFDLSHNGPLREAHLEVLNSDSYRAPLHPHDASSRQRFRQNTPELNAIPDEQLTHYVEAVDLPANALQMVTVLGTTASGAPALLGAYIHVPSATLQAHAARARRGETRMPEALLRRYGAAATARGLEGALLASNSYVNPLTTAVALCFHHPEVMNLNATLGANTLISYIEDLPADSSTKWIDELAQWLGEPANNPATIAPPPGSSSRPGWATLVPQTDSSGETIYCYELSAGTLQAMAAPVQQVLKSIFDDPQYEGSNWNATSGQTRVEQTAASTAPAGRAAAEDSPFNVQASMPAGSTESGIEVVGVTVSDPASRSVQLEIKNRFLRWLIAYVQYLDADGNPLPFVSTSVNDSPRAYYLTEITSNNQIMGIPIMGNNVGSTCLDFQMPAPATTARVIIGSIGCGGGNSYCPEAVGGSVMTLVYNIGLPTMLLAAGVGSDALENSALNQLAPALRPILMSIIDGGEIAGYAVGIYGSETSQSPDCFLATVANAVISELLEKAPGILTQFLGTVISEAAVERAVPIVGFAFAAIGIAASVAAIAVTEAEILSSKALTCNDISLAFDVNVTIEHDPDDFRFPLEADSYVVTVTLSNTSLSYKTSGPIAQNTTSIDATINGVPSGGTLSIQVCLTNASGAIVATASAGPLAATPAGAGAVTLAVKECLIELTAQTRYVHDLKLEYQGGKRVWSQTPQAPGATLAALSCATDATLCQLSQITVSPRTGMVGYGWRSGGLGVGQCGIGSTGILYAFQNLFAASPAEDGFKFSGCGFYELAGLAYDPQGPASGAGNNFYFEPSPDGLSYYVRSVVLDTTTPFDLAPGENWGRFTLASTSVAVHSSGYLVGVSAGNHKLEILKLPEAPVPDTSPAMSPWAAMRSGYGARAGLMNTPVAVTVHDGTILVLEQGNFRIQAFDVSANPVNYFAGRTTPFAAIESPAFCPPGAPGCSGEAVVYLDLACDTLGYLFLLSYVGDGTSAADYRLDIYTPDGSFFSRTTGVAAGRMTVDPFRTLYTLNYEILAGAPRIEPSLSQWLPDSQQCAPSAMSARNTN